MFSLDTSDVSARYFKYHLSDMFLTYVFDFVSVLIQVTTFYNRNLKGLKTDPRYSSIRELGNLLRRTKLRSVLNLLAFKIIYNSMKRFLPVFCCCWLKLGLAFIVFFLV